MKFRPYTMLLTMLAGWINRQQTEIIEYLLEENKILREKFGKKRILLNDNQRRRLAVLGRKLGRKTLGQFCTSFSPDTVLRWHRELVARKYDGSRNRSKYGRPKISDEIKQLILDMAQECRHFGCKKIAGYLKYLGYKVSRSTVRRVLIEYGIDPCPNRPERTTWREFIKAHWESLAATDFFTVEIYTPAGLTRYMILFVIDYATRKVEIAGILPQADGNWMQQMARNLSDPFDGFLKNKRYLIHDRDPLFTQKFSEVLGSVGITTIKISPKSPNMTPIAERFVRTIKSECLDKMIIFGEDHLRHLISTYCDYYHHQRPHQGLDNNMIDPLPQKNDGKIILEQQLGGLLKSYRRV
ncbi:MAG: transposase, partial [Candidatus Marinimicrobia bacterium]|nr:transposase [Candidatus Neomarinimicrobiota bacterium]